MKIEQVRNDADVFSGKLSDLSHQLSFAGIAVVWIFRLGGENSANINYDGNLLFPLCLFVISLLFALIQYAYATLIWTHIGDQMDECNIAEKNVSPCVNTPTTVFFWIKVASVICGYILLASNIIKAF